MIRIFALMVLPMAATAQVAQGPANADFAPAFENQTRAPALAETPVTVTTFASGLENPWGIARLGSGQFLSQRRMATCV